MQQCNVTFHKHSCFQIEDDQCIFLFDWYDDTPPQLDSDKMIYIFNSHKHADHYNPCLMKMADSYKQIQFIWSREIKMPKDDSRFLAVKRGETHSWNRNMETRFKKIMQHLEDVHIDLAFVPLDPRQEERFCWGMEYFLEHTRTDCVFPMHMWDKLDIVKQWKTMPESELYRDIVMEPEYNGQEFVIDFE